MPKLWLVVGVIVIILCSACGPADTTPHDSLSVVYFRDAQNRCVGLKASISVAGSQFAQFGTLDLAVVPDNQCQRIGGR